MDIPLEYLTVDNYHDPGGGTAVAAHLPGPVVISKESYRVIVTRKKSGRVVFHAGQSVNMNGVKVYPYCPPRPRQRIVAELETNPDGTPKVDSKGRLLASAWNYEHEYRKRQAKLTARNSLEKSSPTRR